MKWLTHLLERICYQLIKKEKTKAELDLLLYGNSYLQKTRWGWKRIHPKDIIIMRRPNETGRN